MGTIGLYHFLVLSLVVATAGITTILTKRNAIGILIGVELLLNAAGLNFVAFNRFCWSAPAAVANATTTAPATGSPQIDGMMFTIFIIVLAAAEAAVALGIFLNFYNNFNTIDVDKANELQG